MLMPWLGKVRGVLQAWFPGQEDGNAIAALLFGDVNPSGKLPQTFPKSMADLPVKTKSQYPGVNDKNGIPHAVYSEKLKVGYRWYDAKRIRPLFPFGFGLSYTTFAIRHLSLARAGHKGRNVRFDVANTGHRAGAQVAQVYLGFPASTGEPPKQLKAYARVFLAPGTSQSVALGLGRRSFAHWSLRSHGWRVSPGCYRVMIGSSSRTIARQAVIAVGAHCANARAHIPAGGAHVSHGQGEDRR
jgi:beta-glucosidase